MIEYEQNPSLASGKLKRIHVNQHHIRHNIKCDPVDMKPVITIKSGNTNTYCNEAVIHGESRVVYSPAKPLSCGARLYIETTEYVEIV